MDSLWTTTQNMRKKIMHALRLKWTISIKYFMSCITKCKTGTNFGGLRRYYMYN